MATSADVTTEEAKPIPVAGVSLPSRVPPFWRARPSLWFAQVDALLAQQRVSDETRFQFVVAQLDREDLEQVSDILLSPPDGRKFQTLRQRLIDVYEESEERRLQRLVDGFELGDQTPSQLLRRIRDASGASGTPASVLQVLWMKKLPSHLRAILSATTGDLDALAKVADKVIAHCQPALPVAEVAAVSQQPPPSSALETILLDIQRRLARLEAPPRSRVDRSLSRGRQRARSSDNPSSVCYYHRRWGDEAKNCRQPCTFHSGNASRHQ